MEKLINELIKAGGSRERMEIKVFGGGNVTDTSNAIGSDNAEFVLRYLDGRTVALRRAGSRRNVAAAHPLLPDDRSGRAPAARRCTTSYVVDREESDYAAPAVETEACRRDRAVRED